MRRNPAARQRRGQWQQRHGAYTESMCTYRALPLCASAGGPPPDPRLTPAGWVLVLTAVMKDVRLRPARMLVLTPNQATVGANQLVIPTWNGVRGLWPRAPRWGLPPQTAAYRCLAWHGVEGWTCQIRGVVRPARSRRLPAASAVPPPGFQPPFVALESGTAAPPAAN